MQLPLAPILLGLRGEISGKTIAWGQLLRAMAPVSMVAGFIFALLEPASTSSLAFLPSVFLWSTHVYLSALIFALVGSAASKSGFPDPAPVLLAICGVVLILPLFSLAIELGFGILDEDLSSPVGFPTAYMKEWSDVAVPSIIAAFLFAYFLFRQVAAPGGEPTTAPDANIIGRSAGEPFESSREDRSVIPAPTQAHSLATSQAPAQRAALSPNAPRLADLLPNLPPALGDDILSMSAQDHYVEVVTTNGSHLLNGRLSDCVEALGPERGVQCHRSHWVARCQVRDIQRDGSAYVCVLSDGRQIPVSRRRATAMKAEIAVWQLSQKAATRSTNQ